MIVISMFVLSTTNRAHQRCVVQINPIKYAAPALLEVIVLPFFSKGNMHIYVYDSESSSCYSFILNRWVPLFSTQACAMNYIYNQIPCSRAEGDFDLIWKSTCQHTHIPQF